MRLVAQLTGDPRYTQVEELVGGARLVRLPDEAFDAGVREAVERLRAQFCARFGREPGPGDPVFFDPDSDAPMAVDGEAFDALIADLAERAQGSGVDPAYLRAWQDTGYLVTDPNRHTYTAHQVEAFLDAVQRHRDQAGARDLARAQALVERAVTAAHEQRASEPAAIVPEFVESQSAKDPQAGERALALILGVLAARLTARAQRLGAGQAGAAIAWARTRLGEAPGQAAFEVAAVIGHPGAPDDPFEEIAEDLGPGLLLLALVWLASAVDAVGPLPGGD